jgi:hypothetical protein
MPAGPIKLSPEWTAKGYPFSVRVSTSGNALSLWEVQTTRRRSLPAMTCSFHSVVWETACTCPPNSAVTAWAPPVKGTWFHWIPAFRLRYSMAKCWPVPRPEVAYLILLGFFLGSVFDSMQSGKYSYTQSYQQTTTAGDFGVSLLILSAAVMKADGKVLKSELDYVKQFFKKQFGEAETAKKMLLFAKYLNKIDLN